MTERQTTRQEAIDTLNRLISKIKIAMLTTVDADGNLHSRPMDTQQRDFDGDVWFFARATSEKVREIEQNPSVNVAYSDGNNFVSLAGKARIVTDVAKKKALWKDDLHVWFDNGPESPDVVLIHVDAISAQYWDGPDGPISKAISVIKVMLTGDDDAFGDSARVQF
jgi:general stress protein 26